MEPQLYRCGNESWPSAREGTVSGFNGAATLSLRKFGARSRAGGPHDPGFNGAATLSLRKSAVHRSRRTAEGVWLQWSRNFIVAEIRTGSRVPAKRGSIPCFNGAATLSLRKLGFPAPQPCLLALICFNGAATLSLRKSDTPGASPRTSSRLQWSRNFIVAEI